MNIPSKQDYHYPNKMGRIILLAMEEILGRNGINAVLNQTKLQHFINNYPPNNLDMQFRFEDLTRIQIGLEELYGPRGGQGLAQRSGRACFKYGIREFGPILGISEQAFKLLPLPTKISTGAKIFADAFNNFSDQQVKIEESEDKILWIIERCPICWGRHTDYPVCHLAVGILQESLYWISGGKFFCVEEIDCIAQGAPTCTIAIDKQPSE
jgi:predicted hydrocarbon binding protein